jgi:branched-chain amino acid aminotransferase
MAKAQYVWVDGKFVESSKANVHILTHSLQYGSGIFEGIRAYSTPDGPAVLRLPEHMRRFHETAKIYDMPVAYSENELITATVSLVKKNGLESCYIRPFAFYNDARIGLDVTGKKTSVAIAAVDFGPYFSNKSNGIKCIVSSWRRIDSQILPVRAKASGNYLNSIMASHDAKSKGADEAILLDINGFVAEGPGENIFLVRDNKLVTPSESSDILLGITRDSLIKIAESRGVELEERRVHREELYTADEAFFSGTAAELTPITEIDRRKIGDGKIGPITKMLSEAYSKIAAGADAEFKDWLTYV